MKLWFSTGPMATFKPTDRLWICGFEPSETILPSDFASLDSASDSVTKRPHYYEQMSLKFYCDDQRHLVCLPYSKPNLHRMAARLGIKRCWFHRNHYDIPKRRIAEIRAKCTLVSPRWIARLASNT